MERCSQSLLFISLHLICISVSATQPNYRAIYIFGDSTFDAGNNHYNRNCSVQADFPPYGSSFFKHPTGRFTNGRTVADFLSQYMEVPLQPPFLEVQLEITNGTRKTYPSNGLNFASAGSGVLPATNNDLGVTPLQVQLQQFQTLVKQKLLDPDLVKESIIYLESGSNDIFSYFLTPNSSLTPDAYVQSMQTEVEKFVEGMYKVGARLFVVFGLGPVGCVPARANLPGAPVNKCYDKMNKMVMDYNRALENFLERTFSDKHPDSIAAFGDIYKTFQQFMANPQLYGLKEVSKACCGYGKLGGQLQCGKEGYSLCKNPDEYLFWDFFHPSEHTYKLIAKELWRVESVRKLANVTLPHNV